MKSRLLCADIISQYSQVSSFDAQLEALLAHQKEHWPFCQDGFATLGSIQSKHLTLGKDSLSVVFNPKRIRSVSAKVDPKSIQNRPCFLCEKNLPPEEKALSAGHDYYVFCNPMPIFEKHFTISHAHHKPQRLLSNVMALLEIAEKFGKHYVVFFNGELAGASAPDHLHFQAVPRSSLPLFTIINEQERVTDRNILDSVNASLLTFATTRYFYLESSSKAKLEAVVSSAISKLSQLQEKGDCLLNVLVSYDSSSWHVLIIPRKQHRPRCYHLEGPSRILVGPASVELSGVIVTPRKEDFDKINQWDLEQIFQDVVWEKDSLFYELFC